MVPRDQFDEAAQDCSLLALCNINFSRPLLIPARQLGKPVATDVHALAWFDDDYNRDFMAADILLLSHESLPVSPEESARQLAGR